MGRLSDEDRADLVAYLDGELDEGASQALEARLNLDPQMRGEADALKRTWEMLDYLPRPEPSPSFTNRTLERLAIRESMARTRPMVAKRRWLRVVSWAAAVLLAVGLGRVAGPWVLPGPRPLHDSAEVEQQLVTDLRLLDNKRLYDPIEDLEFLRALDSPDLFGDDVET